MAQGIGPNTNAPPDIISGDCLLLAGEDAASSEPMLTAHFGASSASHAFRSYVFHRREHLTTIISGMGTGCVEPLLWELSRSCRPKRLLLVGTAGAMPACRIPPGRASIVRSARAAGAGLDAIGLVGHHLPRWQYDAALPSTTLVSTDFYYGFGRSVLDPAHPLHDTRLASLYTAATEDLVDMETACFYALAARFMPPDVQYLAIKSPANPAGDGAVHLANTPSAIESGLQLATRLLGL